MTTVTIQGKTYTATPATDNTDRVYITDEHGDTIAAFTQRQIDKNGLQALVAYELNVSRRW